MLKVIDAITLRDMFVGGAKNLTANRDYVDSLNVFPVPDGDTGTNMSMTIQNAVKEVVALGEGFDMTQLAQAITNGSLKGARGNSGVILSQIFKGVCDCALNKEYLSIKEFSQALQNGARVAYSAVAKPKEGTILTVIRVIAEQSSNYVSGRNNDFIKFFTSIIEVGENILAQTPDMLPVLKKAGVVDAGGMGLIFVLKGFLKILKGEIIEENTQQVEGKEQEIEAEIDVLEDITFAYCTEFFITNIYPKTTLADIDKFRDKLSKIGDSLIVIGDLNLVKVHVHTNTPGLALQYAVQLGELTKVKIENMLEQYRVLMEKRARERKPLGIVAVCAGEGFTKIFKELNVDYVIEGGQTMNPSVDDIKTAVDKVNADVVLVLPNNKNIILAAEQAKEFTKNKCIVVPTVNVQSGISAAIAFDPSVSGEENLEMMMEMASTLTCGEVTTAVRKTVTETGLKLREGDIIGLNGKAIVNAGSSVEDTTLDLISQLVNEDSGLITLYYGENVSDEDVAHIQGVLSERYPDLDVMIYDGGQPHYFYEIAVQ